MNQLIDEILDYVKSKNTDYAVMINGKWGSGKTYFWDKELRPAIESTYVNQHDSFSTIYVSLYGVSSVEEINKKLFFEISQRMDRSVNKYMQNNRIRNMSEFTKKGLDVANYYGLLDSSDKVEYDSLFSIKDKVLCFDDVERTAIEYNKLLGYINDFVEHDNIKVILISNEEELMKKVNSEEYLKLKEKVIGSTYSFKQNYEDVIRNIISNYKNDRDVYDLINLQIPNLITIIERTKTDNIRILTHAINDFYKVYKYVTKDYEIDDSILVSMLLYTIAYSYDIKSEDVKISDLINVKSPAFRHFQFIKNYLDTKLFDETLFNRNMEELGNDEAVEGMEESAQMRVTNNALDEEEVIEEPAKEEAIETEEPAQEMVEEVKVEEPVKPAATFEMPYNQEIVEEELPPVDDEFAEALFKNIPMNMDKFFEMYKDRGETLPVFAQTTDLSLSQRLIYATEEDLFKMSALLLSRSTLDIIKEEQKNLVQISKTLKQCLKDNKATSEKGLSNLIKTIDVITSGFVEEKKTSAKKTTSKKKASTKTATTKAKKPAKKAKKTK